MNKKLLRSLLNAAKNGQLNIDSISNIESILLTLSRTNKRFLIKLLNDDADYNSGDYRLVKYSAFVVG